MEKKYKDSGIKWIGKIPEEWKVVKLRNLGIFSASGIDKNIVEGEEKIHIVNYVDVYKNNSKELRAGDYMVVSAPSNKCQEHQLQVGDMIYTPSSETIEDIGLSSVVMEDLPNTAYSYHVLRFRTNEDILLNYKKYITNNAACLNYFSSCATGTIRKTISRDVFKECRVILPPLMEQQTIANFLDKKCGEIDSLIGLQEQMIEKLKVYKQSVISEAVTKGLNPNAKLAHSDIDWVGEIPEGWNTIRIKYLLRERKERSETGEEEPLSMSQKYGLIPTKDMDMIPNIASSFVGAKVVYTSDLVFNKLKAHLGVFSVSKYLGLVSPDYAVYYSTGRADLKFLEYLFKTPQCIGEFRKRSTGVGAGLTRLYTNDLYSILIPFPSLSEQQTIVSYLDDKCSEIDNLVAIKQQKIEKLKDYKKSIIYEAVTGKIIIES